MNENIYITSSVENYYSCPGALLSLPFMRQAQNNTCFAFPRGKWVKRNPEKNIKITILLWRYRSFWKKNKLIHITPFSTVVNIFLFTNVQSLWISLKIFYFEINQLQVTSDLRIFNVCCEFYDGLFKKSKGVITALKILSFEMLKKITH